MWCSRKWLLLLLAIPFLSAIQARATTWYVEQDGSGDFTVIQQAVDAAAPGDTIMIGAGRFSEYTQFPGPGWTEDVYVVIQTDDLTLIGQSPNMTHVGPETPNHDPAFEAPKVIVGIFITALKIINLKIENAHEGIYRMGGNLILLDCIVRGCDTGLIGTTEEGMTIERCQFLDNITTGISTHPPAQNILVRDSFFANDTANISFNGTSNAFVYNCTIQGGTTGAKFTDYSTGGMYDSEVINVQNVSVSVRVVSSAVLERNRLIGGQSNLNISTVSYVEGSGNILSGGIYATIRNSHSTMDFHGNHILNTGGHSVLLVAFFDPPDITINLTGNYWGTTEADSISAWVWDGYDDPSIHAFVDYEPFSNQPLPTEKKSLGEVKALYR